MACKGGKARVEIRRVFYYTVSVFRTKSLAQRDYLGQTSRY